LRKTVSAIMLSLLVISTLTLAFSIQPIGALNASSISATATTTVGGQITSNTTWTLANSPYVVTSNLLVSEGITLTIEPGVVVKFDSGKLMQIDGCLVARGTETEPIVFTSNKAFPSPGDWKGIEFTSGSVNATYDAKGNYCSGNIMKYCSIKYGGDYYTPALKIVKSSPLIDHCNISNNSCTGIYVDNCRLNITNSNIRYNNLGSAGYYVDYFGGGIYISGGKVVIKGNTISNNLERIAGGGIYTSNALVMISGNIISSNSGTGYSKGAGICISGGTVTVNDNIISNNSDYNCAGIHVDFGKVIIRNNTINGNSAVRETGGIGILYGASVIIEGNTITDNSNGGIYNYGGSVNIFLNKILRNTGNGIFISYYSTSTTIINHNNIHDNYPYDVNNQGGKDIDAINNWWGTTDEATILKLIYDWSDNSALGKVIFKPYLTSPVTDFTRPTTPVVTDDGDYTTSTTQLHASWNSLDPESGIAEYQYVIGTSPGGTNIVNWTSTATEMEVTKTGLSLTPGITYYFAVKAKNGQGVWSEVGVSDGITTLGGDPFNWQGKQILDESKLRPEEKRALPYVMKWATQYNINPALLMAMIRQESNFNPKAVGDIELTYSAYGYMQVRWPASSDAGYKGSPEQWKIDGLNPDTNIRYGARYLKLQYEKFQSDPVYASEPFKNAISAYNAGHPTKVNEMYVKRVIEGREPIDGTHRGYLFFLTIYITSPEIRWIVADLCSSSELRVYDLQGRVTGLVNGVVKNEIPYSDCYENTVTILSLSDSYRYEVVGTGGGLYKLTVTYVAEGKTSVFNAIDIPTSANAIHQYIIDWDALSQGEEGVTVQVDSDGNEVFEHTFTSDNELTRDEFMPQVFPVEAFPMWIAGVAVAAIAIVTIAIAVFWRRRKLLPSTNLVAKSY